MSKQHVEVTYEEDKCLITLFCECQDCSIPLAEIDNGCTCPYSAIRRNKFINFGNDITQEEATTLLAKVKEQNNG
jgi:hypothetical protein